MDKEVEIETVDSLAAVAVEEWNALAGGQPFVRHEFLHALETSGCVGGATGWLPMHLLLRVRGRLAAALPLYLKHHSRGEYVFDRAWAEAHLRLGLRYYPKLVSAVPFTPVTGPRLLGGTPAEQARLLSAALDLARGLGLSSLHILFPGEPEARMLAQHGLLLRRGVQFHWHNAGYGSFEEFLAALNREKRKKIRQERRRLMEAGVSFERRAGGAISAADWAFFERCYRATYQAHGMAPYLNLAFFEALGRKLGEHCLLVLARQDGDPIAAALFLFDHEALYGRYWGTLRFVPGLHFETCCQQGIEFAIERGLARFEGGAQGEHKLARGLLPATTWSAHWLADTRLSRAVERFLEQEAEGVAGYVDELNEHSPFRRPPAAVAEEPAPERSVPGSAGVDLSGRGGA